MLNSSTSTSITTFDIDVFTDFSLLFSPFFVSNIFVRRGHIVPLQQSFHKKIKQRRNCLCFALAMASDSFQRRNSHGYRNTVTSRTTSWNNCEHREIKKLLSLTTALFPHGTQHFLNLAAKNRFRRCPFYTALRNCSEPP